MDLDSGERSAEHRDEARQQRHARGVERVRDAVGEQRVDAGPRGEDLGGPNAAGGRIAIAGGDDVSAELFRDPRGGGEPEHDNSVAAP
jgi:hypothetical protein